MAGTSDRGSLMEDWMAMPPTPSPRTLMSSFLNEDFGSGQFSNFFGEHVSNKPHDQSEKRGELVGFREQLPTQSATDTATPQKDFSLQPNSFNANQKSNPQGSLAERRASRAGFSIPKIDTSRVGSSTVIRSPIAIPPGLSPTTLLESPVFLYNAMAQPSPTTGKLFVVPEANSTMPPDSTFSNDVFSFQPHSGPASYSNMEKGYNVCHQNQSLSNIHQQGSSLQSSFTAAKDSADETIVKPKTSDSVFSDNHSSEEQEDDEGDQNEEYSSATNSNPAEDGYNWRKYGQKQVKSSEHPRSYYKCTHPDCPVKKKVERSQDGQITEIVYKSSHNHPLPPPNRRSGIPLSQINDQQVHVLEKPGSHAGLNTASLWENGKSECIQDMQGVEGRPAAGPPVSAYGDTSIMESQDAADVSSTLSNEIDRATQGTISLDCDVGEDETESKRRKLDALAAVTIPTATTTSSIDMVAAASRAVREPRVVVQTTSEVDILDDGYRWRKYGQKVVKGNPNPRSYYKCTHQGCSVRKHVERASHDLKSVITTYEGKHNHEVPAARNSGNAGSGSGSAPASAPQANLSHRRQEQAQGSYPQFGGATPFGSFGLPPRGHLGAAGNFHFGMAPPGMSMPPMPAARHPSMMQGYQGLMMQEGQMKAEPDQQSGFAASSAYQQMMGRPPFGPQM
ncbi:probable WRKY transcription factor 2 [Triticum urartu]|uniref:WRKY domain-containing protein n=1 Tax=Triticum urartu TaxID=4572 RepID=A0A8R7QGZ1_TRIUA|nr:probable WRKY transcription factor 2 [Triticum urartu]XP_048530745.1 probable WRKY transcription factor 2 [Triticum urartu]